jgi:precorrin-2 dehydrogenase/sirohydrochlorin ferrochelatase
MVDLSQQHAVVVGGGQIANRRIESLLDSGANITVVSPEIIPEIYMLVEKGQIHWRAKTFQPEDLAGAFLIIAATSQPEVNQMVKQSAPPNALVNIASDASAGNVHFPAHFKQGRLSIAISSGGASPLLAVKIKEQLQTMFGGQYGDYLDFLYESRQRIKQSPLDEKSKNGLLKELLSDHYQDKEQQLQLENWLRRLTKEEF